MIVSKEIKYPILRSRLRVIVNKLDKLLLSIDKYYLNICRHDPINYKLIVPPRYTDDASLLCQQLEHYYTFAQHVCDRLSEDYEIMSDYTLDNNAIAHDRHIIKQSQLYRLIADATLLSQYIFGVLKLLGDD